MKQKDNGAKAMGKGWSNNAQSDYIYGILLGAPLILGFMMGGSYLAYHTNPCIKRQQISLEQRCINKENIETKVKDVTVSRKQDTLQITYEGKNYTLQVQPDSSNYNCNEN